MKKGIFILTLLILALFSVSCIYAADVNDTLAASEDTGEIELSHENEMESTDNNLKTSEEQIVTQTDNEEKIGETADETLNIGNPKIHGMLDDQIVSLELASTVKNQSEVHILSCNDIKYPDSLNVTYEITNMSNCIYVIKDSQGEIVKQGNITRPNSLCVEGLKPGSYSILINNTGSQYILPSSANATFSVYKGDLNLMIVVFNETYPDEAECIVHADAPLGLMYNLTVTGDNGVAYSSIVCITNRVGHFDIGVLDAGNYTATIFCIENDLYDTVMNHTTFEVSRHGTNFEVEISDIEITYGGTATVIPILPYGATGNITYHLNDGSFLGKLAYNESLILPILDAGSYVIIANYSGDIDDLPAFDSVHLIVDKVNTVFEVRTNVTEITYGETATVMPILPANATGTIKYYLADGTVLGELAVGENLTLPMLDAGSHVIYANYSGDTNFFNATANATLTVNKANSTLTINDNVTFDYNTNGSTTVSFTNASTVVAEVIGQPNAIVEVNGTTITVSGLDAGNYTLKVTTLTDENHNNVTKTANITVNKAKTELAADAITATYNINKNLVITLNDSNGNPVSGVSLSVDLNGAKTYTTDKNGQIKVPTKGLTPKTYAAKIAFAGNDNYLESNTTAKVTINKDKTKLTAKAVKATYNKNKNLVITLKDSQGKALSGAKVAINLNGAKTYTTDKNGQIKINVAKLVPKTYTAKVTFNGNTNYDKSTVDVKVTVKKAKAKIKAKKKTYKANKKNKKFKITLKDNKGKPIKKAKVRLIVKKIKKTSKKKTTNKTKKNKKKNIKKTNKKGKITFKINRNKKGKYMATVKFYGNKYYAKTVKKVKIKMK